MRSIAQADGFRSVSSADHRLDRCSAQKYSNTPVQPQADVTGIARYSSGADQNHQHCR